MRRCRGRRPRPARCSCSRISISPTSIPSPSTTRLRRIVPDPGQRWCLRRTGRSMPAGSSIAPAQIWIGGANIFFGTTPEPSHDVQRTWHTESNLTEYSPLFTVPQQGRVDLGNLVNDQYTSHYPRQRVSAVLSAGAGADIRLPPPDGAADVGRSHRRHGHAELAQRPTGGDFHHADQCGARLSRRLRARPERRRVLVHLRSQRRCRRVGQLRFNTPSARPRSASTASPPASRRSIPGSSPAASIPYLWRPIPGVHTLNFEPYRVDLTPFAGVLSNGQPHTVAVNVYNADRYFSATANLLLYQDAGSHQVTGAVTTNTIGQPDPAITENITHLPAIVCGTLSVHLEPRLHGRRQCAIPRTAWWIPRSCRASTSPMRRSITSGPMARSTTSMSARPRPSPRPPPPPAAAMSPPTASSTPGR